MSNGKLSGGGWEGMMGKRVFYTLTSFFRGIKGIKVLVWYQTYLSDVIISAALI